MLPGHSLITVPLSYCMPTCTFESDSCSRRWLPVDLCITDWIEDRTHWSHLWRHFATPQKYNNEHKMNLFWNYLLCIIAMQYTASWSGNMPPQHLQCDRTSLFYSVSLIWTNILQTKQHGLSSNDNNPLCLYFCVFSHTFNIIYIFESCVLVFTFCTC